MSEKTFLGNLTEKEFLQVLEENTLYKVITGSTSYGLNTKDSDVDTKAIVMLPKPYLFQMGQEWETETFHEPDTEFHSLKKAFTLLNSQNPTMLEMLYVLDKFIIKENDIGKELRKNRHLFLSQNCYHSFGGYAREQLMRIKNGMDKATLKDKNEHLEYTLNRMIEQFPAKYNQISNGNLDILQVYYNEEGKQNVNVNVHYDDIPLSELNGFISELSGTMKTYNKVNNRNRKPVGKLEKHASHLVRLLLAGIETLETGIVPVFQEKHRELLMNFKNGNFEWDYFFALVDDLNEKLNEALKHTDLPKETDFNQINQLYTDLMLSWY